MTRARLRRHLWKGAASLAVRQQCGKRRGVWHGGLPRYDPPAMYWCTQSGWGVLRLGAYKCVLSHWATSLLLCIILGWNSPRLEAKRFFWREPVCAGFALLALRSVAMQIAGVLQCWPHRDRTGLCCKGRARSWAWAKRLKVLARKNPKLQPVKPSSPEENP